LKKYVTALGATLFIVSNIGIAGAHEAIHQTIHRHSHHLHQGTERTARAGVHRHGKEDHSGGGGLSGIASIYSGGRTASGQQASPSALTAAHRSLPFGTLVRVTNEGNGRAVVVRINDRGPFVQGRVIDLMPAAARALGFSGLAHVSLTVVGHA
jgi:rare lipoprotein A